MYRITAFSLNKKPCGSSEGTTSDPLIVGTLPAPKNHNEIFIIAITRWSFEFLKMYFYKIRKRGMHTKSRVMYVKKAAATTSRTRDQGNQNPKLILKTTRPSLSAFGYFS